MDRSSYPIGRTRLAYSHGSEVSSSVVWEAFGLSASSFRPLPFLVVVVGIRVGAPKEGSDNHTRRSANDETIANNLNFFILLPLGAFEDTHYAF